MKALRHRINPDVDPAGLEKMEHTAIFQTGVLMFAAGAIGLVVWLLLSYGYPVKRELPRTFLELMLFVLIFGFVTAYPDRLGHGWAGLNKAEYSPRLPMRLWGARRPALQRAVVFVLSFCLLQAFVALVWGTGLGIESPFIPLVTAPAVFGPFVALNRRSVITLVVIVSLSLAAIATWAPTTRCPNTRCMEVSSAVPLKRGFHDAEDFRPRGAVYLGIAVTLVLLAGLIAANRLERENKLETENEKLTGEIARLMPPESEAPSVPALEGPERTDDDPRSDRLDPV